MLDCLTVRNGKIVNHRMQMKSKKNARKNESVINNYYSLLLFTRTCFTIYILSTKRFTSHNKYCASWNKEYEIIALHFAEGMRGENGYMKLCEERQIGTRR